MKLFCFFVISLTACEWVVGTGLGEFLTDAAPIARAEPGSEAKS